MKKLLFIIVVMLSLSVSAREYEYPVLPQKGKHIEAFLPPGYTLLHQQRGDLNNDGTPDLAAVFQGIDSVYLPDVSSPEDTVYTRPRILLVLLMDTLTDTYLLHDQHNSFILSHYDPNHDDPFDALLIRDGCLLIRFRNFMHSGSWYSTTYTYSFRLTQNEFVLTDATVYSLHRASGEVEEYHYDFVQQKRIIKHKGVEDEVIRVKTDSIVPRKVLRLKDYLAPMTWQVDDEMIL